MPVLSPGMSLTLNEILVNAGWQDQPRVPAGSDSGGEWAKSGGGGHRGHIGVKGFKGGSPPSDPRKKHIVLGMAERGIRLRSKDIDLIDSGRMLPPQGYHEVAAGAPQSFAESNPPPQQFTPRPQSYAPSQAEFPNGDLQSPDAAIRVQARMMRAQRQVQQERLRKLAEEAKDPLRGVPEAKPGESFTDHALRTLIYTMESLDKPRRAVVGTLGGKPREALNIIPFSDYLGLTKKQDTVTGRDLLEKMHVVGPNLDGFDAGDIAGFVVDLALDPLTWIGAIGPISKAAKYKNTTKYYPKLPIPSKQAVADVGKGAYREAYTSTLKSSVPGAASLEAAHQTGKAAQRAARDKAVAEHAFKHLGASTPVDLKIPGSAQIRGTRMLADAAVASAQKTLTQGGKNTAASVMLLLHKLGTSVVGEKILKDLGEAVSKKLGRYTAKARDTVVPTAVKVGKKSVSTGVKEPTTVGGLFQKAHAKVTGHPKLSKLGEKLRRAARYANTAHQAGQQFLDITGVKKEDSVAAMKEHELKLKELTGNSTMVVNTTLTANFTGGVRNETWKGKQYLVAPLSLIVEGVLNGSKGPLHYPMAEIKNNFRAWNGTPIVVYHPTDNQGRPQKAQGNPEVLSKSIGVVRNACIKHPKLVAEGWFDAEQTKKIDPRVYNALTQGKKLELSTGLHTDNEPATNGSSWNGRSYTHIARNYRPDHLAILPDQVGACSLNDGCGVLVNTENMKMTGRRSTNVEDRRGWPLPTGPDTITTADDYKPRRKSRTRKGPPIAKRIPKPAPKLPAPKLPAPTPTTKPTITALPTSTFKPGIAQTADKIRHERDTMAYAKPSMQYDEKTQTFNKKHNCGGCDEKHPCKKCKGGPIVNAWTEAARIASLKARQASHKAYEEGTQAYGNLFKHSQDHEKAAKLAEGGKNASEAHLKAAQRHREEAERHKDAKKRRKYERIDGSTEGSPEVEESHKKAAECHDNACREHENAAKLHASHTLNGWIRRGAATYGAIGGATLGGLAAGAIGGGLGYAMGGVQGAKDGAMIGGAAGAAAGIVRGGGEGLATGTALEQGVKLRPKLPFKRRKKKAMLSATLNGWMRRAGAGVGAAGGGIIGGALGAGIGITGGAIAGLTTGHGLAGAAKGAILGGLGAGALGGAAGATVGGIGGHVASIPAEHLQKGQKKARGLYKKIPKPKLKLHKVLQGESPISLNIMPDPDDTTATDMVKTIGKHVLKRGFGIGVGTGMVDTGVRKLRKVGVRYRSEKVKKPAGYVANNPPPVDNLSKSEKNRLSGGALSGAAIGAGRGALAGSFAGPAGTVLGTIGGAAIGAGTGAIGSYAVPKLAKEFKKSRLRKKAKKLYETATQNEWSDEARAASLAVRQGKAQKKFAQEQNFSHSPSHHQKMADQYRRKAMQARRGGFLHGPNETKALDHEALAGLHEAIQADPAYHAREAEYHRQVQLETEDKARRGAGGAVSKGLHMGGYGAVGGVAGVVGGHMAGKVAGRAIGSVAGRVGAKVIGGAAGATLGTMVGGLPGGIVGGAIGSSLGKAIAKPAGIISASAVGSMAGKATGVPGAGLVGGALGYMGSRFGRKPVGQALGKAAQKVASASPEAAAWGAAAKGAGQAVGQAASKVSQAASQGAAATGAAIGQPLAIVSGEVLGGLYGVASGASYGYGRAKLKAANKHKDQSARDNAKYGYHKSRMSETNS